MGSRARPLADRRPSTVWTAPTRARPIPTIRRASCRPAASAPTDSSSGVNGQRHAALADRRRLRLSGRRSSPAPRPRRAPGAQVGAGAASHVLAVEQLSVPAAARRRASASSIAPTCSRRSTTRSRCPATRAPTPPCIFTLTEQRAPAGQRREPVRHAATTSTPTATRTSRRASRDAAGRPDGKLLVAHAAGTSCRAAGGDLGGRYDWRSRRHDDARTYR